MEEQLIRLDEINLCNVLRDLIRNAWVVVLVVASLLLCVDTYEKNTFQPEYASEATFMVSAKGNSSQWRKSFVRACPQCIGSCHGMSKWGAC